ncbi:MAG TPA: hypothetical protein VGF67_17440 [Ktedonobacteraceae bacterium]
MATGLIHSGQDRYTLHQTIADDAAMQLTELLPVSRSIPWTMKP